MPTMAPGDRANCSRTPQQAPAGADRPLPADPQANGRARLHLGHLGGGLRHRRRLLGRLLPRLPRLPDLPGSPRLRRGPAQPGLARPDRRGRRAARLGERRRRRTRRLPDRHRRRLPGRLLGPLGQPPRRALGRRVPGDTRAALPPRWQRASAEPTACYAPADWKSSIGLPAGSSSSSCRPPRAADGLVAHPVGDGSQHLATVYADDLADLVLRALERGSGY